MYLKTSYCIKLKSGFLNPIASNVGLKQGCPLSPLLFNIFIEDVSTIFNDNCDPVELHDIEINHLLYADDLVILSKSASGLAKSLENLDRYCENWHLKVKVQKTKVIIFRSSEKRPVDCEFRFRGAAIEIVQNFCYLGINISSKGTFKSTRLSLKDKGYKALFPLFTSVTNFNLPPLLATSLFKKLITPILTYGCEVWATLSQHQIKGLSEKPVTIAMMSRMITYWHRVATMDEDNLTKKAYSVATSLTGEKSDWISTVRAILKMVRLDFLFDNPAHMSTSQIKARLKSNLTELFTKEWNERITQASPTSLKHRKLRCFKLFKTKFEPSKYLQQINDFATRQRVAKFRCSDHDLMIELGRHKKLCVEERVCKKCNDNAVEDEIHFLCECPMYNDLRKLYFNFDWTNPPIDRTELFKQVLTDESAENTRVLGKFLKKAYLRRNSEMDIPQPTSC